MFQAETVAKSFSVNLCDLYVSVVHLPPRNGVHGVTEGLQTIPGIAVIS